MEKRLKESAGPSIESLASPVRNVQTKRQSDLVNYSTGTVEVDTRLLLELFRANGLRPIHFDLTRRDYGFPVVRVIVPGLELPQGVSLRRIKNFVEEAALCGANFVRP